jgi:hypothetical protein
MIFNFKKLFCSNNEINQYISIKRNGIILFQPIYFLVLFGSKLGGSNFNLTGFSSLLKSLK